jgi:hypothetical protein
MPLPKLLLNAMVCTFHSYYIIGFDLNILACDFSNNHLNFPSFPIFGILCDGRFFEFFSFDGSTSPPTFSRGVFYPPNSNKPLERFSLTDYCATSDIDFICSVRPICEVLFYFLLLAYKTGTKTTTLHSIHDAICPQESMSGWNEAHNLAIQALNHAMGAAAKAATYDCAAADEETKLAFECLQKRFATQCFHHLLTELTVLFK